VPIPAFNSCDPDDYVCCTELFDVADRTSDIVYAALLNCLPEDCRHLLKRYVMQGIPADGEGDYLAVWLVQVSPATNVNQRLADQSTPLPLPRATYAVQLMETGWPVVTAAGVPSADELHHAASHSYGHAETMLRSLYGAMRSRRLPGGSCVFQQMGALVPIGRSGGLAGWRIDFTIGLSW
jgi:hypothetical protein